MAKRSQLFVLFGLSLGGMACSDYDLYRPDEAEKGSDPDPEPDPDPPEDPDIAFSPALVDFGGYPKDLSLIHI